MGFLDWGSDGWKGVNASASSRPGWEQPGYDDSTWSTVGLPLGSGGGCPIHSNHPRDTNWPVNTEFLLRRSVAVGGTLEYVVDNELAVYVDGVSVLALQPGYPTAACPERGLSVALPVGSLLAIRCKDNGVESYADFRVEIRPSGIQIGRVAIGPGTGVR